ncbi:MAG: MFS transporter [Deltaproteobacteria bacterium]|nr:MFS transporter [Deltaproteobacteria bacterium]
MTPFNALCSVGFLARFSYALARNPVLPLFALYLGAGPEAIGLAVGISTVTGIFFKMPSGALSDVIGRRKTLLMGLVVFGVMPFTYLLVNDYTLLIVIRFLHGLATAIYGPVAMAVVADIAGARKGEWLSWFSSVTILGTLAGAPVGGFLLTYVTRGDGPALHDFRLVFLLSGLAGAAALLLGLVALRGKETVAPHPGALKERLGRFFSGIKEVVSDRRVVITSNMEGLQNLTVGALEAFLPVYAVKVAGLNEFQAGLLWGVQVLTTILSKPMMGRMSDRWGRKSIIVAGMVLCAGSFAAIPLLTSFILLLVTALVFGLGEAFVTSSSAALVADVCQEKHFGAAMGAFGTIFDIGHASGPILAGLLIARFDYFTSFVMMAVLLLIAIPVFVLGVDEGRDRTKTAKTV